MPDQSQTQSQTLSAQFNRLQDAHPAKLGNAKLLTSGSFGIIAAHEDAAGQPDGTMTKIFYRINDDPAVQENIERAFQQELKILRQLKDAPLENILTPTLVDEPQSLEHDPDFSALYRMTTVPGVAAGWNNGRHPASYRDDNPAVQQEYFREAGRLSARFHKAATLRFKDAGLKNYDWGAAIVQVPELDAETNKALAAADRYLQAHKKPAIIHGDFHGGNVLADERGHITGLIDFSEVGWSGNYLSDFTHIPPPVFAYFKEGYEQESGEIIDPAMMTMTRIGINSHFLSHDWGTPEMREKTKQILLNDLKKVQVVAGSMGPAAS